MKSAPHTSKTGLSRRASRGHGAALCACIALSACGNQASDAPNRDARIRALETKVNALTQQLEQQRNTDPARALATLTANAAFDIDCPAPWQQAGPLGDAIWTCRAPQPSAAGMLPNCNVTLGTTEPEVSAKQYFEESLAAVPQLKAARRISARDTALGIAPAFECVYDHGLLGKPLRVLSTLGVLSDRVYAVNCSAAPEEFAAHEAVFRRVTQSFKVKL